MLVWRVKERKGDSVTALTLPTWSVCSGEARWQQQQQQQRRRHTNTRTSGLRAGDCQRAGGAGEQERASEPSLAQRRPSRWRRRRRRWRFGALRALPGGKSFDGGVQAGA
ncbi:hypothetical protein HPB50_004539 [Hyalomma asiaticum]|uniref:Uncharacterized protein n=1 Tax=Hyalomma asiaticum TaxID=266040 RepID=A0ACB7RYE9_HYAAI|nr:hypothetical protein HPB50_004539 [Hyalomma asiaticum]